MTSEPDIAAQLIERLLTDPAFRAQFRRDPAGACRAAGLEDLAQEMSLGAGNAMMTLDQRESKSSLAGVMMAAAMEGVGVFQFAQHVAPALADAGNPLGDVLSRVNLPAVSLPGRGALAGGAADAQAAAVPVAEPEAEAPAPAPAAPAAAPPAPEASAPPEPELPAAPAQEEAAEDVPPESFDAPELPSATDLPEPSDLVREMAPATAAAAPAAEPVERPTPDPDLYGQDGPGSPVTPEVRALLDNPRVKFDEVGVADLKAGRIDPRVVAALTRISQEHEITVTCMCSDHARMSASGNVSNHAYGRGVDIGTIDGELVRPGSPAARELSAALAELDPDYRPNEVGTPFAIASPGYFTDAAHQDHIHFGFKEPISSDWTPPPEVAADGAGAAAAPAAPGAPPPPAPGDSGAFQAVVASAARASGGGSIGDSGTFMAVQPVVGPPTAIAPDPAAVPAPVVDPAANAAGGSSGVGAKALAIAHTQTHVKETGGEDRGADVETYLAAAGVPPGNPWCASFVAWSLEQAGHKMEGGGWAGVATWVQNAQQGKNDLSFVDAADARPGDLVVYDWGGQDDFGADGHMGFLASKVENGQFTALEGNAGDRVQEVPRHLGGANVKFIRVDGGDGGPAPVAPAAAAAAPVVDHTSAANRASATPIPADAGEAAPSRPPDPSEYGREGSGGPMTPEIKALLENPKVKFDDVGIKDLKAGRIDPRAIALLTKLSQEHEITVTCMCSDHPRGPGSNHYYGRGVDIGSIDGEIVRPGSAAARELAGEIAELSGSLKPTEVGTPFAIAAPGYFTDAAHQDHIHVGWDDPIDAGWKPPADVAAPASASAPVAASASASAAAAPVPGDSGAFMAVAPEAAGRSGGDGGASDSGAFMAVGVPEPAPAGEPPPAAVTGSEQIDLSSVGDEYPGDDAPKEQLAAWLAREAEKRGLPPQLPVMAALVESGVRNLNHGHADSVGFFQMRVGIWDRGEYAGFPDKPELQAKWFLDTAEQVKAQRVAAGKPIDDPKQYGEWIADVERPAAQYRGRYQLRLQEADNLLKQATASSPAPAAAEAPDPGPAPAAPASVLQAVTPPAPAEPAPAAPPERPAEGGDSGTFTAVSAEGRAGDGGGASDSGSFMAVPGPEADAPQPAVPVADAAASAVRSSAAEAFDPDLAAVDPEYPGDDAPKDQIAKWMAKEARARGIPPELPVMAALVESNLQNLDYGHSTSLGYFQMLEHYWNKGEYAGYPDNPRLQLKWFLDTAEQVKAQRVAAGKPIDDPTQYGEWIADVERPAEQYRGRYQLRLSEARRLLG